MISPPRAAFVLVAYNQERFIDAAIDGAFAQDYPNLDIVLSDDGSRDQTHAIMLARAAAYVGPHHVVVNQTRQNRGTVAHVYEAAALARGELVVLGAGDDVSRPNRVSALVAEWRTSGADALWSGFDVIDADGLTLDGSHESQRRLAAPAWFPDRPVDLIRGATSAYSRAVFDHVACPPGKLLFEDTWFTFVLAARSRLIRYLPAALVAYRAHEEAITHGIYRTRIPALILSREARSAAGAQRYADVLAAALNLIDSGIGVDPAWGVPARYDRRRLVRDIAYARFQASWLDASAAARLRALGSISDRRQLVWLLPRLAGPAAFVRLKLALTARNDR